MLATLVIGLREGLEASLIVGIIAAFLKRNGKSLRPMWAGVIAAVLLSIAVGVCLQLISESLPQAQQEGLESIIGAVAVVFVTGMIVWMSKHARHMRGELEASATAALGEGTAWALAGMAFLAVLKEGFETSVFLLATFQASTNFGQAALGAVIGVLAAVAIGYGIYRGGVRLNLGRFFTVTGIFLVFVAAGLVVTALRTAHEAGWVNIGQQRTVDLSWLAPNGSIQAALVTGVLGIPADPRVIEVLAWFLYLIPVLLIVLWPASLKPRGRTVPRVQFGIAGGLAVAAVVLAIAVPSSAAVALPASAPIVGASGSEIGTASANVGASGAVVTARHGSTQTIRFTKTQMSEGERGGVAAEHWQKSQSVKSASRPATVSLTELIRLNGGRIPVGVDAQQNPGPYSAAWTTRSSDSAWTVDGRLLDATTASTTILTISRGGLPYPRTLTLTPSADASNWRVEPSFVAKATAAHASSAASGSELMLWKLWLPLVLGICAVILAGFGVRGMRRLARDESRTPSPATTPVTPRSTSYAAK